jgi:uncharacterized damage-inducible protein DinB
MKRVTSLTPVFVLIATVAFAQGGAPPQGQKLGLAQSLQNGYNNIKRNLTEMAAKMDEANYNFQPTRDVRTYGQLFGHVANAQFGTCAALKGEANPNQGTDNEKKATKAELVKALNDSFTYCDAAFAALTDANVTESIKQGMNEVTRAAAAANLIAHSNEMYGTGAVYMRLKGLVPPSTERAAAARRPGN